MNDKVIEVNKLWNGPTWKEHTQRAERIAGEWLSHRFGTQLLHVTEKFAPEYDMMMSDGSHELKITRGADILVEFARADGTPSGISISQADFYVILHRGYGVWTDGVMREVGKFRRIPTSVLKQVVMQVAEQREDMIVTHEASVHGPGSMCVRLHASKQWNDFASCGVDDGWLVDIGCDPGDGIHLTYDFGREGKRNRNPKKW